MATIARHRGTTISVGSGDKGTTILAAFGAPVAFDSQRSAAVFAANEMVPKNLKNKYLSLKTKFKPRANI